MISLDMLATDMHIWPSLPLLALAVSMGLDAEESDRIGSLACERMGRPLELVRKELLDSLRDEGGEAETPGNRGNRRSTVCG